MTSFGNSPDENPNKPVAYDQYGRPLYAHPAVETVPDSTQPTSSQQAQAEAGQPAVVYISRAINPKKQIISEDIKRKHTRSHRMYPHLNLSEGEYVISAIRRHLIGIISIWAVVVVALIILFIFPIVVFASNVLPFTVSADVIANGGLVLVLVAVLVILGGVVATVIYDANRFYLTNESVMQHIQTSLFSKKDQTISLGNIEDASYRQKGILQTILNYGAIRLSTEGEETTYRFNFVSNPQEQVRLLNNAVEAFKNYRQVDTDENDD